MVKVLSICALVLAGAALALSAAQSRAPAPPPATEVEPFREREELEVRLAALEENLSHLSLRLRRLEQGGRPQAEVVQGALPAAAGGMVELAQELRQLREDLHQVATAEALGSDRGRAVLKEVVRSAQEEAMADRVRDIQERRDQSRKERLTRFVEEARLTTSQEREVRGLLEAELAQRQVALGRLRSGERGREIFGELRQVRQGNDEQVKKLLAQDQFVMFQAMRQDDARDFRSGGWPDALGGAAGAKARPVNPGAPQR